MLGGSYSKVLAVVLLSLAIGFTFQYPQVVSQQEYPTRPINIIVPWSAGGGTDRTARFLADRMSERLGVPVVVLNRTGGGGAVGHTAAAFAVPDGYTLGLVTLEISTMRTLGLTTVGPEHFRGIIQYNEDAAGVIVHKDAPWQNASELLDYIRKNPGELKFSGTATGGIWDLARIGMLIEANIDPNAVVWVPSTGAAPAVAELLGRHIDGITTSLPEARSQLEAGQFRALAVMSDERHPLFPDVPTLKEQGIDWSAGTWRGIAGPAEIPDVVVETIHDTVKEIMETEEWRDWMLENGFGIRYRGPGEFQQFTIEQEDVWRGVMEAAGYIEQEE